MLNGSPGYRRAGEPTTSASARGRRPRRPPSGLTMTAGGSADIHVLRCYRSHDSLSLGSDGPLARSIGLRSATRQVGHTARAASAAGSAPSDESPDGVRPAAVVPRPATGPAGGGAVA